MDDENMGELNLIKKQELIETLILEK